MKVSITFHDLDVGEAAKLLSASGVDISRTSAAPGNAPAASTAAPARAPLPAPVGTTAPAPSAVLAAPPAAPAAAPAPALAAPPAAPAPAPAPAATNDPMKEVIGAMQAYSAAGHKTAGVKAVLAKCGLAKVTDATPEQAAWLLQAFNSKLPPEQM